MLLLAFMVVVFFSVEYYNSVNCIKELTHAKDRNKLILPVIVGSSGSVLASSQWWSQFTELLYIDARSGNMQEHIRTIKNTLVSIWEDNVPHFQAFYSPSPVYNVPSVLMNINDLGYSSTFPSSNQSGNVGATPGYQSYTQIYTTFLEDPHDKLPQISPLWWQQFYPEMPVEVAIRCIPFGQPADSKDMVIIWVGGVVSSRLELSAGTQLQVDMTIDQTYSRIVTTAASLLSQTKSSVNSNKDSFKLGSPVEVLMAFSELHYAWYPGIFAGTWGDKCWVQFVVPVMGHRLVKLDQIRDFQFHSTDSSFGLVFDLPSDTTVPLQDQMLMIPYPSRWHIIHLPKY
ncbi:hypothetical protein BJ742DRAFT_321892 [Cladochytrium replicatum]|nr:hypothetical protein BJ742DRAFT_321892 [Cladochytrium replicatum]